MNNRQDNIRNFSIIAHIDHGKSTLADRLLEHTGALTQREMQAQILDNMDLERERGITIKARAVKLLYKAKDNQEYTLNLIDTPGHVDFNYEVSRSLAACEGAVLVVDAAQGIEAQTLANTYLALEHDLELVPVINKIDLPSARPDEVKKEVEDVIGIDSEDAPLISAKNGINIEAVLEKIVELVPPPSGDENAPLKALIFDSYYDPYKGVIVYVRVVDGKIKAGQQIKMMATGAVFDVVETGYLHPNGMLNAKEISAGEVGFIAASIKTVSEVHVGDTVTSVENGADEPLPGYKEVKPMVYCGIYPADGARYDDLREALEKLQLNDAALKFDAETSVALGFGFRVGFLGLLHMEIITERLEREFNLDIITTAPSVSYIVHTVDGRTLNVSNPSNLPKPAEINYYEEPIVNLKMWTPPEYIGALMDLATNKRGIFVDMQHLENNRTLLNFKIPLNEIVYDFFDRMKSCSHGYASLDYEPAGYQTSKLVKMDILLNGKICDALSLIVHESVAYTKGKALAERLKDIIPRQMFEVPIQAAIGGKIIARETVKALRKDVLAKCYGGDITRKMKLLEKQKAGKKKMRMLGSVEVPSEAFVEILKI